MMLDEAKRAKLERSRTTEVERKKGDALDLDSLLCLPLEQSVEPVFGVLSRRSSKARMNSN